MVDSDSVTLTQDPKTANLSAHLRVSGKTLSVGAAGVSAVVSVDDFNQCRIGADGGLYARIQPFVFGTPRSGTTSTTTRTSTILGGDFLFNFGSSSLRQEAQGQLLGIIASITPTAVLTIIGNTDSIGSASYNQTLSVQRATSVYNFLRAHGVTNSMSVVGHGESDPIAPNTFPNGSDNPAGRALNRRVEIIDNDTVTTVVVVPPSGGLRGASGQTAVGSNHLLVRSDIFSQGYQWNIDSQLSGGLFANSLASQTNPLAAIWDPPVTVLQLINGGAFSGLASLAVCKMGNLDFHIQAAQDAYLSFEIKLGTGAWISYGFMGLQGSGKHVRFTSPCFRQTVAVAPGTNTVQVRTVLVWYTPLLGSGALGTTQYIDDSGVIDAGAFAA